MCNSRVFNEITIRFVTSYKTSFISIFFLNELFSNNGGSTKVTTRGCGRVTHVSEQADQRVSLILNS
jgi:hypothetical protein